METMEDLWSLQRVVFQNDVVRGDSERKFKPEEGGKGEMKKVFITLRLEKSELDKSAVRLRLSGKILDAKPLEYVRLNTYHTINVAPGDVVEVVKEKWPGYVLQVVRSAVSDTKKPRLGLVVVDEEKALPAYLLGYGVEFKNEIYSGLSKRMSQKDFTEQQNKYYEKVLSIVGSMNVDTVVIAGPGFAKDDIKKYGEDKGIMQKMGKRLVLSQASNSERSGVYELIRSDAVAKLLERERIRTEFLLMEKFLSGLSSGSSKYGIENVKRQLEDGLADTVLVNDSFIGRPDVQETLSEAERMKVRIEVFNSGDEVGTQLHSFSDIAAIPA
ncbi:MAG: pelota family protein [Candidatus Micrarchaeota archaeon]|nr:pelota family protein [Candidatus Micrarchaeota archaeon]